ncbi:MAG: NADH-quinone oxidoreductase subunit C, partial [Desulfobacterales bacterium]
MDTSDLYKLLLDHFGDEIIPEIVETENPYIKINRNHIQTICAFLRYNPKTKFFFLSNISGVDYPDKNEIDIVYHLFFSELNHLCTLKT